MRDQIKEAIQIRRDYADYGKVQKKLAEKGIQMTKQNICYWLLKSQSESKYENQIIEAFQEVISEREAFFKKSLSKFKQIPPKQPANRRAYAV